MLNAELAALDAIKYNLPALVKELKRMNKLRALEMKLTYDVVKRQGGVSLEYDRDIDAIMNDKD